MSPFLQFTKAWREILKVGLWLLHVAEDFKRVWCLVLHKGCLLIGFIHTSNAWFTGLRLKCCASAHRDELLFPSANLSMWSPERLYPSHHIIENVCVWRVPTKCHAAVTMDEIGPTVRFPGPGRPGTAGAAPAPSCCLRPVTTCVRSYQTNFGHRETPSHPKQTGRVLQRRLSNISGNRLFLDKNKTSVSKWLITLFPVRTVERLLLQRQQKQAWGGGIWCVY